MKSYTDLPQSKKLAEFLPLESADMTCIGTEFIPYPYCESKFKELDNVYPAWSLAALLNILPSATLDSSNDHYYRFYCMERFTEWYDNAIDACVAMIVKLHKMNLL